MIMGITITTLLLWGTVGYLLGSITSGVLIARMMNLGDLREIGSGNVLRTGNKKAAALTLLFDALKGAVAVLLARYIGGEGAVSIAAVAALIGHCFPVWLRFKVGKGVATYFGIMFAAAWPMGFAAAAIRLIVAGVSRYSSVAALVVAGWLPLVMMFTNYGHYSLMAVILAIIILIRHWGNIQRLKEGTESKIGAKAAK